MPGVDLNGSEPYTNWNEERNWFNATAQPHVQSQPSLYGKVGQPEMEKAFNLYNNYRSTTPNRGDAYNKTLDDLDWWGGNTANAATSGAASGGASGATAHQRGSNPSEIIRSFFGELPAAGTSLKPIVDFLNQNGYQASIMDHRGVPSDDKITVNGQDYDLIYDVGSPRARWQMSGGGGGSGFPGGANGLMSSYAGQFTDPLTKKYEQLLSSQTGLYQQQQAQMQQEVARKQAVRGQTEEAVKKLLAYVNQRTTQLQGPAYTGREQEIMRTQALDPIERDRTASRSRALDNIGSRGFDPSSGIAQDLMNQVDRGYDSERAGAQGELAYKQIMEERSRQQEAQKLMQYAAQLPEAAARGDLSFVQYLNEMINQPGQNALATQALLAELPVQRTQLGAQILGLGGSPQSSVPNVMSLLNNAQQNRYMNQQNYAGYFQNLGRSF